MDRLLERLRTGGAGTIRVPELAEVLGCSRGYIYKLIDAAAIKAGRVGSDYRIPLREAQRLARDAGVLE